MAASALGAGALAQDTPPVPPVDAPEASDRGLAPGKYGPAPVPITLTLNGKKRTLRVEPRMTLLSALRNVAMLTGTKEVCDRGACGACTVWLDGLPVQSCQVLAIAAHGAEIVTIEGLAERAPKATAVGGLHPVQHEFVECDALQCGFCTPGMVMTVAAHCHAARAAGEPETTPPRVAKAIAGNLCRCGAYPRIVEAGVKASRRLAKKR